VSILITNIGELVTNADPESAEPAASFQAISGAALVLDRGTIAWAGPASRAPAADEVVDAGGRAVLPGFVDSHAHLVFAGERGAEFAARMAGQPYAAGGIASTPTCARWRPRCSRRARPRSSASPVTG
jgi:imidazolonepropionase